MLVNWSKCFPEKFAFSMIEIIICSLVDLFFFQNRVKRFHRSIIIRATLSAEREVYGATDWKKKITPMRKGNKQLKSTLVECARADIRHKWDSFFFFKKNLN